MAELGHVHTWGAKRFIDGCHFVVIEKTCKECGEVNEDQSPRDFGLNPLQIAFADPDCARCREAAVGYEPACWA